MEPVWCCKNAFDREHWCLFAYCNACHLNRETPGRANIRKRKADNLTNECEHYDLQPFGDEKFLDKDYLKACKEKGYQFPDKCVNCKRFFTTTICAKAV